MSGADRKRWNQRYAVAPESQPDAAWVLSHHLYLLPPKGSALDLACGHGGNALLMARLGLNTQAWDIAEQALTPLQQWADAEHLPLTTLCVDLDQHPLPTNQFDVICASAYLNRTICPALVSALKPGGLLFYQTFTRVKAPGSSGPSNPEFLLAPSELLQLFAELEPLVYRQESDAGDLSQGLRGQAALIARKSP